MSTYYLRPDELWFPMENEMGSDIVAMGGDLSPERLILAYSMGIFPWYNDPGDVIWWCPEQRAVLYLDELHVSHSMRNILNRGVYRWTMDQAFSQVIEGCRGGDREGETWIIDEVVEAYTRLHEAGFCHSVEVWEGDELVGGLYGVSLGRMFFGESMFSRRSNASKFGFIQLCRFLHAKGWNMIDCQMPNEYLQTFGVRTIPRELFLDVVRVEMKYPTFCGNWGDRNTWKNPVRMPLRR